MSQSTTPYRSSVLAEFRRAITNVAVPHHEPPGIVRRRRVVVGVTLVIGAVMLGFSLRRTPGESSFYWLTLALAAVWIAGALMLWHLLARSQSASGHHRDHCRAAASRHLRGGCNDRQGNSWRS